MRASPVLSPLQKSRPIARTLLGASAILAAAGGIDLQAHAQGDNGIEEIVVTAQKRSEAIETVPISITAFTEETLERSGIETLSDLARAVPGLTVVSAGPGQNQLSIRGIASSAGTAGTVGYYIDDTPVAATSNAGLISTRGVIDPALFDLQRIEVLRGPQGTLYGSSSMGGTIRYITRQPDLEKFTASAKTDLSGTDGGGFNYQFAGTVNAPVVEDKLAVRIDGFYRFQDGFIDKYPIDPKNYLAVKPGSTPQTDVNTEESWGFRGSATFAPTDRLTITPSIYYQQMVLGAPFTIDSPPGSFSNLIQNRDVDEASTDRFTIYNLTAKQDFDQFQLLSSTSYYNRNLVIQEDSSKVLEYFFAGLQDRVYASQMRGNYDNREFTEEVRATSTWDGPIQGVVGAFYHYVRAPLESQIPIPTHYNGLFEPGGAFYGFSSYFEGTRHAVLREKAFFTDLSWEIVDGLKLSAGLRAFNVTQKFVQTGQGVLNGGDSSVGSTSSDTGVNPKFELSYQVTPDNLFYATAAKGYRAGGPNNPAPASLCGANLAALGLSSSELNKFGPDTVWSYEVGEKSTLLDKRLTLNAAGYYIDWDSVQQQIVLNCGFNITANFGKAVSRGGEFKADYSPVAGLNLKAAAGYTNAILLNAVPGTGAVAGDRIEEAPRWNVALSAEYRAPVTDEVAGFGRIDYTYTSSANDLYDRTSNYYQRGGYSITNVRFGLEGGENWEAALYVDNLFNKEAETSLPVAISADLPTTRRLAVNRPRTIGIDGRWNF